MRGRVAEWKEERHSEVRGASGGVTTHVDGWPNKALPRRNAHQDFGRFSSQPGIRLQKFFHNNDNWDKDRNFYTDQSVVDN